MGDNSSWLTAKHKKYILYGGIGLVGVVGVGVGFGLYRFYTSTSNHVKILFDEDDQITPQFKQALRKVFIKYDKDGDGVLNRSEVNKISLDTEGVEIGDDSWNMLPLHYDVDEDGNLTLTGFYSVVQKMIDDAVEAKGKGDTSRERECKDGLKRDLKVYGITYNSMKTNE